MQTRTKVEVDNLKRQWLGDSSRDLANTEGFEVHKAELQLFQEQVTKLRERQRQERLLKMADRLAINANIKLAGYLASLESRIEQLEEQLAQALGKH